MAKYFNTALSHSLGNLTHWKQEPYGLSGETSYGKFRIQLYNDHTVRIQVTREEEFEDFSYAVFASQHAETLSILIQTENLLLKKPSLVLTITKYPFPFAFYLIHNKMV